MKGIEEMRRHHRTMIIAFLVICSATAHGHLRDYLVTYPYWTVPRGMLEMELFNDFNNTDSGETVWVNQTELEYGLTDRLDIGLYAVTEKKGSGALQYAKTKIRTRYRLAGPGRLFVDPALYFEYQLGANGRHDKIEAKLLLSRDFGPGLNHNITFNAIAGKSREPGSRWETGYALGLSRVLSPKVTAGIELKDFEGKAYAIPGLYITLGAGRRLNIGTAFGLSDKADDFQVKTLVEYEFF